MRRAPLASSLSRLLSLAATALLACTEQAPPPALPRPAPPAPVARQAPVTPVHLHPEVWQQLCGNREPERKGECRLLGMDEAEDGSVLVAGGWEGSARFFGAEATSAATRSLALALFAPDGALVWSKLVGKKDAKGLTLHHGAHVLALGGGLFAVAGAHGASFDLGSGPMPVGPSFAETREGFLAILRRDGSLVAAVDLDTAILGAPRSRPAPEMRPFGLHPDGEGGVWVLAGRPDEPIVAARISPSGATLARVSYPVMIRNDALNGQVTFRSKDGADRVLATFRMVDQGPDQAMAVARDGSLLLADPDATFARGLNLHRFTSSGVQTTVALDLHKPLWAWWRAHVTTGPQGEAYITASTTGMRINNAILGPGVVVPLLMESQVTVARVEASGSARWTWTSGPLQNFVTALGATLTGSRLRAVLGHRDDLAVSSTARAPTPQKMGLDSVGTPGLSVVTFDLDGAVLSADTLTAVPPPCPVWLPNMVTRASARGRLLMIAPPRDVVKDKDCGTGFGWNGGSLLLGMKLD